MVYIYIYMFGLDMTIVYVPKYVNILYLYTYI